MGRGMVQRVVHFRQRGNSAAVLKLSFDRVSYTANSGGAATSAYNAGTLQVTMYVDNSLVTLSSASLSIPQSMSGSISWSTPQPYTGVWENFTIASGATISGTITITAVGSKAGVEYTQYATITIEPNKQGAQGNPGTNGTNGKDAAILKMSFDKFGYKANYAGNAQGTQTSSWLQLEILVNGTSVGITSSSAQVQVQELAGLDYEIKNTYGVFDYSQMRFTVADGYHPSGTVVITASGTLNGTTYTAYGNVMVEANPRPAVVRGPRVWKSGTWYYSGAQGEQFLDIVIYNGSYYQCIKKTNSAVPGNTEYWSAATYFDFVATNLLLAERSRIVNLVVDEIMSMRPYIGPGGQESLNGVYSYMGAGDFQIGTYDTLVDAYGNQKITYVPRYVVAMVNKNGVNTPVIRFLDADGEIKVTLDETIYDNGEKQLDGWEIQKLIRRTSAPSDSDFNNYKTQSGTAYYKYQEGFTTVGGVINYTLGKYNSTAGTTDHTQHSDEHNKWHTQMDISNTNPYRISTGYYVDPTVRTMTKTENNMIYKKSYMNYYYCQNSGVLPSQPFGVIGTDWEPTGMTPQT